MKISVVVPVYKVEKQISRCLDSLLNQTYEDIEIICVGDKGVVDKTYSIVERYARKNKKITFFYQDGRGLGAARNYGIKNSKGNYLVFIDSDDFVEKDFIEKMHKKMIDTNADIVCCGFDRVDDETNKVYSKEMMSMTYDILDINEYNLNELAFISPAAWGKMFKKSVIDDLFFSIDKGAVEDLLYYLRITPKIKKITFIKETLYHYTVRNDSLIFNVSVEKSDLFKKNLLEIKEEYKNLKNSHEYLSFLDLIVFIHLGISMTHRIGQDGKINTKLYIKDVKKYMNENFAGYKEIKLKQTEHLKIKNIAIYVLKYFYKFNIFILFIKMYNFMINKLKVDIKW